MSKCRCPRGYGSYTKNTNLDVDNPGKVSAILRAVAQEYYESAGELESAWGDRNAGIVWQKIAVELERMADKVDGIVAKYA